MKINILGQKYKFKIQSEKQNPKMDGNDGFCERYIKEICVRSMSDIENDPQNSDNLEDYFKKVMRHEIVHAYLYESGLDCNSNNEWALNEEIVDWIAIQLPKLFKTCKEVGAL